MGNAARWRHKAAHFLTFKSFFLQFPMKKIIKCLRTQLIQHFQKKQYNFCVQIFHSLKFRRLQILHCEDSRFYEFWDCRQNS